MGIFEQLRADFLKMTEDGTFNSLNDMAVSTGIDQKSLRAFLKENKGLSLKNASKALDYLDAKITYRNEGVGSRDLTRPVKFVEARKVPGTAGLPDPDVDRYRAVPLVADVSAGSGLAAEENFESWVLVYQDEPSIRQRSRLIAVRIGKRENSMEPLIHPGDIVIVDLDDTRIEDGSIYLVRYPDTEDGAVKRVKLDTANGENQVVFYSDNSREHPPRTYAMRRHYPERGRGPVVGRAIWHWTDITHK